MTLCDSFGLSGCRQDEHQAVGTVAAFSESFPWIFTSGRVLADINNQKNILQVGIIPALICFNEIGGEG